MKKIIGIGNALVDILCEIPNDQLLDELELPKGSMQLVDAERSKKVRDQTKEHLTNMAAGGSASNTIRGIAHLGGSAAYMGMVGDDELGKQFENELQKANVKANLFRSKNATGNAAALISKDGERTFATYLGAAIELSPDHISNDLFNGYDILHIEGYLVQNHELIEKALISAKKSGLMVSIDMASYNVVEENLSFLQKIVSEYVDIVFANEEEAKAFTGLEPEEALDRIAEYSEYAIVKVGKNGSFIKHRNQKVNIGIIPGSVIDTTGAGDLYAAGFLYGLSREYTIQNSGEIAKILSGNIIQVTGASMDARHWSLIQNQIQSLEKQW